MKQQSFDIASIFRKFLQADLTTEEQQQLDQWLTESLDHQKLFDELQSYEFVSANLGRFYSYDEELVAKQIAKKMPQVLHAHKDVETVPVIHRVHFLKLAWTRYAAAILLIILAAGGYYIFHTSPSKTEVAQNTPSPVLSDIMPGSNKAILTLSNGQQIPLHTDSSETIRDGSLSIENNKGELHYKNTESVGINTMTTPKGGQYQLTLSEGTKVWLNAASAITFPTAFEGSTREVLVSGEVYFEVAKNRKKPFIVKTPTEKITVVGTEFNVNAYPDEVAKTSLINGTIKINDRLLQPGQAFMSGKVQPTSIEQDIAWKNGIFNLENKTVEQAMKQLARWYDVEVVYETGTITTRLSGAMDRKLTLNEALEGLNGLGARFRLTGRTVYVSPLK